MHSVLFRLSYFGATATATHHTRPLSFSYFFLNFIRADPKWMNIAKKNAQNRAKKKTKAVKDLSRLLKDAMNLGAEDSINRALCEERLYPVLAASPPFHLWQFHKCVVVRNSDCMQKYMKWLKRNFRLGVIRIDKNMVPILKGSCDIKTNKMKQ
nr:hypothetical protein [Tanacetum cinerariifolium]